MTQQDVEIDGERLERERLKGSPALYEATSRPNFKPRSAELSGTFTRLPAVEYLGGNQVKASAKWGYVGKS